MTIYLDNEGQVHLVDGGRELAVVDPNEMFGSDDEDIEQELDFEEAA